MGTHPSCPSTLLESGESLKEYVEAHPELLGDKIVKYYGKDLPFLFKVRMRLNCPSPPTSPSSLAIIHPSVYRFLLSAKPSVSKRIRTRNSLRCCTRRSPISTKVRVFSSRHIDHVFTRRILLNGTVSRSEPQGGHASARDLPQVLTTRVLQPEMAVALTPFSGFCGFRPPKQIASFIDSVPEFAAVLGNAADSFRSKFGSGSKSDEDVKEGLKEMFTALMTAYDGPVAEQVEKLVSRLEKESGDENKEERELVATLNRDFPGDVGIFCTFVLNIVHLKPGEAVFLKANEPHAYLDGGELRPGCD